MNYFIKNTTGPSASVVAGMSASVTDENTVRLTADKPNPIIPDLLTSYNLLGLVISPAGLTDPTALKTQTFGAGPYYLDPAKTVAGDHYTYVLNKNYYGGIDGRPQTLVLKVIPSANSQLQSLRAGQVNMMLGDKSLVAAAKSYKLNVFAEPHSFCGFLLADRGGKLAPALEKVAVRQAMNYAIDRKVIARAAVGEYGKSTTQPNLPGWDSYSDTFEAMYPYDPAKAKALLAEAGYPDGFTFKIGYASWEPVAAVTVQAMAEQLAKVGIKVQLVPAANGSQLFGGLANKEYSGISLTWGGQPFAANYGSLWTKGGGVNPWNVVVEGLDSAYQNYETSQDAARGAAAVAAQKVVMENAATVTAVQADAIAFADSTVSGFSLDDHGVSSNVADWKSDK